MNLLAQTAADTAPLLVVGGLVGALALTAKLIDTLKLVTNLPATRSSLLTQLGVFLVGIGVVFLFGASQFGARWQVEGISVSDMNAASKIIVGLAVAALASVGKDFVKARDTYDTAAMPPLIPSAPPLHVEPPAGTVDVQLHPPTPPS